jgi:hypothetical protein
MIKAPKEFYILFQENQRFIDLMRDMKDAELNMEVEKAIPYWSMNHFPNRSRIVFDRQYIVKIFNLYWSATENVNIYEIDDKQVYVDNLNKLREQLKTNTDELKTIQHLNDSNVKKNIFGHRVKSDRTTEYYQEGVINQNKEEIIKYEVFLGERISVSIYPSKTYENSKKYNSESYANVLNIIEKSIKEYKSIKYCTSDIILF